MLLGRPGDGWMVQFLSPAPAFAKRRLPAIAFAKAGTSCLASAFADRSQLRPTKVGGKPPHQVDFPLPMLMLIFMTHNLINYGPRPANGS